MALTASLESLAQTWSTQTTVPAVIASLVLSAILSGILARLYVKYGTSLSNRSHFGSNFVLIATTTTLIIMIVKSSLALSLGLVGALSIVRFRAAIKEPEELSFLFIAIAIGLGFGAYQWMVTIIAFIVISILIMLRHVRRKKHEHHNLYLTMSGETSRHVTLSAIMDILIKHCKAVRLKRFDKNKDAFEASFLVDLQTHHHFSRIKNELEKLSDTINITYLDKEGIT